MTIFGCGAPLILHIALLPTFLIPPFQIYIGFPIYQANYTGGGSICSGWQLRDPNLCFFFNGTATNYHPSKYQCAALGYLSLPVQVVSKVRNWQVVVGPLGPSYQDDIITDQQYADAGIVGHPLAGAFTGILTLGGYPGIIAQENRRSILGLTRRLEKTINATGRLIRNLQQEIEDLHQGQIQVQIALDFLLAKSGFFCHIVQKQGCRVQFHDLNASIEDELASFHTMIQHNEHIMEQSLFSLLTSWLPDGTLLRTAFYYGILALCLCLTTCCLIQCIPSLIQTCRSCASLD